MARQFVQRGSVTLSQIDLVLRTAGIAVLLLMALLLARDALAQLAGWLLALFAVATAAYLAWSAPGAAAAMPDWLHWPLLLLAQANPVLFYLAARAMFDDGFRLLPRHALLLAAMVGLGLFCIVPPDWSSPTALMLGGNLRRLATIALVALAIFVALRGRTGDLLAGRMRFRFFFALGVGLYSIAIAVAEIFFFPQGMSEIAGAVNAGAIAVLAAGFFFALFSLSAAGALAPQVSPARAAVPALPQANEDEAVLAALKAAMERDRLYRDEGLSIGGLAARLDMPEYRLRRAINQQLGFRNFSAYVNQWRLAEIKAALADPAQRQVSITTMALDAGFASLGPFNRAFKAETGLTPSDFRRQALSGSGDGAIDQEHAPVLAES